MIPDPKTCIGAVSLDRAKEHCRIDDDEEDSLVNAFIVAATQHAEHVLGREIVKRLDENALADDVDSVPEGIKAWVCIVVAEMYEHRGLTESGDSRSHNFDHLLDPYKLYWDSES